MLTPADMINIQSAIDGYEKRFPNKPSPSAKEALEWQAGLGQIEFQPNTADRDETGLHGIWYRACKCLRVWQRNERTCGSKPASIEQ